MSEHHQMLGTGPVSEALELLQVGFCQTATLVIHDVGTVALTDGLVTVSNLSPHVGINGLRSVLKCVVHYDLRWGTKSEASCDTSQSLQEFLLKLVAAADEGTRRT